MEHWMALFRGWYPAWLSELRSWNTEEALLWIGLLVAILATFKMLHNLGRIF